MLDMILSVLIATVASGTCLVYASLGGALSENSGVMNLGAEGIMLVGAAGAFITVQLTGSLILGILVALLAGVLMGLVHALLTISLKANQVVSGLALTIFGTGFSAFIGAPFVGSAPAVSFHAVPIPLLSSIPYVGDILFNHNILVYISFLLVPTMCIFLYRTRSGMLVRCVGENPAAADAAGVNVFKIRYLCVMAGGALMGLAGAYLSLAYNSTWMEGLSGGKGWIAVALVIFATWNPAKVMPGAYLFGAVSVLGLRLQAFGVNINSQVFNMLPYLATIFVLIFATGGVKRKRSSAPAALGTAYEREAR